MVFILICVGMISNILGTLAGGGGLITLPTMLLLGMPAHSAIGANKVSNMVSTFSSFVTMLKRKEVSFKEALPILTLCSVGGILGGLTASFFDAKTLTILAIVLLIFSFLLSLIGKSDFGQELTLKLKAKTTTLLAFIGFYDGVFGPGSGTLLLYLFGSEKLTYMKAVLLGRVGIFSSCTGAAIMYIFTGHIMWYETVFLMIGSIIGAQIGMKLARIVSVRVAKIILRSITILLIAELLIEFFKM